jgi:hypothetical protein
LISVINVAIVYHDKYLVKYSPLEAMEEAIHIYGKEKFVLIARRKICTAW